MILKNHSGFTLIDAVITVAVLSFTLAFAIPAFQNLAVSTKSDKLQDQIATFLRTARADAIEHQTFVTVCPLDQSNTCKNQWSGRIAMFEDDNRDRQLDHGEKIIRYLKLNGSHWQYTKSPASRGYFGWGPMGTADGTMGSVTFCLASNQTTAKAAIVSLSGRIRVSRDFNGDGIDETTRGHDLSCPG